MTNTISEAAQIKIVQLIAKELGVGPHQVAAAVALLDEGSTVPFIARYRKEVTGNLDDTHLRNLEERLLYLRELEERRAVILASIEEQGKLTDELRGAIEAAATKQALEDIYLPYKPKRRTRAQIAREAGLEPLADALFADPTLDPQQEAAKYVNVTNRRPSRTAFPTLKAALDGARDILCRAFCRNRRAAGQTARPPVGAGHRYVHGDERQGNGRGRKIPRLLRLFRDHTHHPLASRARAVPRPRAWGC